MNFTFVEVDDGNVQEIGSYIDKALVFRYACIYRQLVNELYFLPAEILGFSAMFF